ncbi:MAG: sigma-70 family RNA polymerase sigma factor [Planctomycetota bacterium]
MSESAWFDPAELLEHDDFVRALVRRIVVHDDRVDDAVQETWLQALQARPRNASSLRSWLGTIARNFGKQQVRGDVRRRAREQEPRPLRPVPTPEEILEREALRSRVVEAVLELKEPYRSAILLRFFEELSNEEVAERLGIPLETARTRIKRGLDALRQRLQGRLGGDWRLMLMPLLGREVRWEPTLTSSSIAGALIMSAKLKVAAGVAIAILVAGGYWLSSESGSASDIQDVQAAEGQLPKSTPALDVPRDEEGAREVLEPLNEETRAVNEASTNEVEDELLDPVETQVQSGILVTVLTEDDQPVADCEVLVGRLVAGEELSPFDRIERSFPVARARTATGGSAEVALTPGRYAVAVDGASGFSWPVDANVDEGLTETTVRIVPVASVDGRALDEAGLPIEGAKAYLVAEIRRGGYISHWDGWEVVQTGEDGTFVLEGIPVVENSSFSVQVHSSAHGDRSLRDLEVVAGERIHAGDFQFFERLFEVRGTVVDSEGLAVGGAILTIKPLGRSWEWQSSEDLSGRSDESGMFRIGGLKAGEEKTLHVFSERHGRLSQDIEMPALGTFLDLGRLVLEPLRFVARGHVVDAHRVPVGSAVVKLHGREVQTDENGYFQIPCETAGPLTIVFSQTLPGEGAASVRTTVKDVFLTDELLELVLRPKCIRFDLVDEDSGTPVRSESMLVKWETSRHRSSTRIFRSGGTMIRIPSADVDGVGLISFEIFTDGFEPATADVEIPEKLDDEIVVTVPLTRK